MGSSAVLARRPTVALDTNTDRGGGRRASRGCRGLVCTPVLAADHARATARALGRARRCLLRRGRDRRGTGDLPGRERPTGRARARRPGVFERYRSVHDPAWCAGRSRADAEGARRLRRPSPSARSLLERDRSCRRRTGRRHAREGISQPHVLCTGARCGGPRRGVDARCGDEQPSARSGRGVPRSRQGARARPYARDAARAPERPDPRHRSRGADDRRAAGCARAPAGRRGRLGPYGCDDRVSRVRALRAGNGAGHTPHRRGTHEGEGALPHHWWSGRDRFRSRAASCDGTPCATRAHRAGCQRRPGTVADP